MAISKNYGVLGKFSMGCKAVDIEVDMKGIKWKEINGFDGYEISDRGQIIDYLGQLVYPNEDGDVFLYKLVEGKRKRVKRKLDNLIVDVFAEPKKITSILVKDLNGNLIGVYPNMYLAGKAVGTTAQQVGCCISGVSSNVKGFIFEKIEVEDTEE